MRLQYSLNNVSELVKKAAVKKSKGGRVHIQILEGREFKSDDQGGFLNDDCFIEALNTIVIIVTRKYSF